MRRAAAVVVCLLFAVSVWAQDVRFRGEVRAGQRFEREIGRGLTFTLDTCSQPAGEVWCFSVFLKGSEDNFAECPNPPFRWPMGHELPTSYFANQDNTALRPRKEWPERTLEFALNAADNKKLCDEMIAILYTPPTKDPVTGDLTVGTPGFQPPPVGQLEFEIKDLRLANLGKGRKATIDFLAFEVRVTFPGASTPKKR